jgi:hypothetical protein
MRMLPVLALLGSGPATQSAFPLQERQPLPYAVGERATYDVHYSMWPFGKVGTGTMEVVGIDTVRGRDAYKFMLTINGGIPAYRIRDTLISWVDTANFHSLRFVRDQEEGGKDRMRRYEIFPDRAMFSENGKEEKPTSPDPLDDVSLLYFVRSRALAVGENHSYERYFRPDRNPLRIIVLRRESIEVPAGKFKTLVVQPIVKAGGSGVLSEKDRTEVWFADDSTRKVVQMKIRLNFGAVTLKLKSYRATAPVQPPPG